MIDTIVQQQAQQRERYKIPQQILEQALKGDRFQISKNDFIAVFCIADLDARISGVLESMGVGEKDTDIALDKKVFYEKMEPYLELLPEGEIRELCAKPKKEVDTHTNTTRSPRSLMRENIFFFWTQYGMMRSSFFSLLKAMKC